MARTIRRNRAEENDPRHYSPSKRARKIEKRQTRQAERRSLAAYLS